MAIIIRNVSSGPLTGIQQYTVRINSGPIIAAFEHVRDDGLAECLRKAARAVDTANGEKGDCS